MELLKDINGSLSSKRVGGYVSGGVVLITFVLDGFDFFTINESIAQTIFVSAAAMIGVGVLEKKQPKE